MNKEYKQTNSYKVDVLFKNNQRRIIDVAAVSMAKAALVMKKYNDVVSAIVVGKLHIGNK